MIYPRFRFLLVTSLCFWAAVAGGVRAADAPLVIQDGRAVDPSPTANGQSTFMRDGNSRYDAKQYDQAIAAYQQVSASDEPAEVRVVAQIRIARCHMYKGDRANALEAYLKVADNFPKQPGLACESLLHAGTLSVWSKDYDAALKHYQRAVDTYGHASPYAHERAAEAQLRIGNVYLVRRVDGYRQIEKALAAYQRVLADFPDQTEWVVEAKMQILALKLEYAINGKAKYADAETLADQFLKENPDDTKRVPTVRMVRAEALFHQNKLDEAIQEIGVIQERYSASGQPAGTSQFLLAQCYDHKGDYERAVTEYQKFLDTVKTSFSAWEERPAAQYGIGTCLKALGRGEAALEALKAIKTTYPNSYFVKLADQAAADIHLPARRANSK